MPGFPIDAAQPLICIHRLLAYCSVFIYWLCAAEDVTGQLSVSY